MKFFLAVLVVFASVALSYQKATLNPLSDEFIASINSKKSTWKAGRNFAIDTPLEQLRKLNGVLPRTSATPKLPLKVHEVKLEDIPESFDAREAWPDCADVIGTIRDQASCGSCWAFGAVEAMSDRICIDSNGKDKTSISAEDLNNCCLSCGNGCYGGWPEEAWNYWSKPGIVSGGLYGSTIGCKAYSHAPCDHHVVGQYQPCGDIEDTPQCDKKCDETVDKVYSSELRKGSAYTIRQEEAQIQTEIMTNGPVEADFDVYEDFLSYKSGVYQHVQGEPISGHAIKILGWGVEDGTPYWLIANSWNEDWGEKGYFKMLRGSNECSIESDICAGKPQL